MGDFCIRLDLMLEYFHMNNIEVTGNTLKFKGKEYKCAIGSGGINDNKKEGDGVTPIGCFNIRKVFYRANKIEKPKSVFITEQLQADDAWCDDVDCDSYNTHIKLPHNGSYENLWRGKDDLYDIIVVLGYNDSPVVKGKGSAIFMHTARRGYTPTAGCVALSKVDLLEVLANADLETKVCVE